MDIHTYPQPEPEPSKLLPLDATAALTGLAGANPEARAEAMGLASSSYFLANDKNDAAWQRLEAIRAQLWEPPKNSGWTTLLFLALFLGGAPLLILCINAWGWGYLSALLIAVYATAFVYLIVRDEKLHAAHLRPLIKSMRTLGDVRAIPLLLDLLAARSSFPRSDVQRALCALLPKIQRADAQLINGEQHRRLRQFLLQNDTELVYAILLAFQQIATLDDLPLVEKLARGYAAAGLNTPVCQAACDCRDMLLRRQQDLQARNSAGEQARSLLRPSAASPALDMLLRPVTSPPDSAPEQLLRLPTSEQPSPNNL